MMWNPSSVMLTIGPLTITWYGFCFAMGYVVARKFLLKTLSAINFQKYINSFENFIFVGMILGARLGHVFFYSDFRYYFDSNLRFFKVWEGGLASHGAILGALLSIFIFKKKFSSLLSYKALLDAIVIPALIVAGAIRIGNMFNQELLGTPSDLPWAITFLNPWDPSKAICPRHPVQLYATIFYWGLAIFLVRKNKENLQEGTLFGLALMTVFSFRILLEFFKEPIESPFLSGVKMGQLMSLPFILLGAYVVYKNKKLELLKSS